MRIILAAAAAIALSGAPALAQERHDDHHPDGASSAPMDMSKMTAEEMHRHCAAMMGGRSPLTRWSWKAFRPCLLWRSVPAECWHLTCSATRLYRT